MKDDGFLLLLSFAAGALFDGVCGDKKFRDKVFNFLLNNDKDKEKEIKEEVPEQLKSAWRFLNQIAKAIKKDQLSKAAVSLYVLGENIQPETALLAHNAFVMKHCRVWPGVVEKIEKGFLLVKTGSKKRKIYFFRILDKGLKEGDKVAYHRGHLVCRINKKQFNFLTRI